MAAKDRLVIGIDFGTTYSGVAAAYSGKPESADEIQVIKTWPGGHGHVSDKVPSELAYGATKLIRPTSNSVTRVNANMNPYKSPGLRPGSALFNFAQMSMTLADAARQDEGPADKIRWGYQLRQDEVRLRCMKLFLDPTQDIPSYISKTDMNEQLRRSKKDAQTAVSDYLTELFKHTREVLVKRFGEVFIASTEIAVVLTVPAVWSEAAQDATLQAAKQAAAAIGMSVADNLTLISEPEAAAVYALQAIQPSALNAGDNFVIVDAGGGTVDLISYEIEEIKPLRIKESTKGSGKCCGSAFLNVRFEQYVRSKIGESVFLNVCEKNPRSWLTALENFENFVKRNYDPDEEDLEFSIPFPGVPNDPDAGIEGGYLSVPSEEVGKMFQPVVDDIIGLVEEQMSKLKEVGKKVSAIVMVGGFGQSDCLHKALQKRFGGDVQQPPAYSELPPPVARSGDGVVVMQPINAWTAVVRGAVLRGLEGKELVTSRKARNNYGVACRQGFIPGFHPESCKVWDTLDEEWQADNRMRWYIRKGETVSSSEPVKFNFYANFEEGDPKFALDSLVVSGDDEAPGGYDSSTGSSTKILCRLPVDLNKVPSTSWTTERNTQGSFFERLHYALGMQIKSGQITFDCRVGGVSFGEVIANFS